MRITTKHLLSLLFFLVALLSCKNDRPSLEEIEEANNTGIMLDTEIMGLGNFFGDVFSEAVLVHVQNGPALELKTNELRSLLELTESANDFFVFNIHQQQTLTPSRLSEEQTAASIQTINQESVAILAKVIRYFKNQNKKVFVFGTGFGAYLMQELLVQEGKDIADNYLLIAGRLDMPELVWQSLKAGNTGGFIKGKTPYTGAPSTLSEPEKNLNKLKADLAQKKYTEALAQFNDLTNLTYGFGTSDETMGCLSQNEKALLITRQANLLTFEAGHWATIEGLIDLGFQTAFLDN